MKKVVAVIPARSESARLAKKNYRKIQGRSLIDITLERARQADVFSEIVLSSDDGALAARCAGPGARFVLRPARLATAYARSLDVVLHALDGHDGDVVYCLLQATSPRRTTRRIRDAVGLFLDGAFGSLVSVTAAGAHPYKMLVKTRAGYRPVQSCQALEAPDQELPPACLLNGALYLGALASLRQERSFFAPPVCWYEMDEEESIDVNTAADLQYARRLAARDRARDKRRSPAA